MMKDEGWDDDQLLADICKLWKCALILNRPGSRDQIPASLRGLAVSRPH
jgi:hypothetical protein